MNFLLFISSLGIQALTIFTPCKRLDTSKMTFYRNQVMHVILHLLSSNPTLQDTVLAIQLHSNSKDDLLEYSHYCDIIVYSLTKIDSITNISFISFFTAANGDVIFFNDSITVTYNGIAKPGLDPFLTNERALFSSSVIADLRVISDKAGPATRISKWGAKSQPFQVRYILFGNIKRCRNTISTLIMKRSH